MRAMDAAVRRCKATLVATAAAETELKAALEELIGGTGAVVWWFSGGSMVVK